MKILIAKHTIFSATTTTWSTAPPSYTVTLITSSPISFCGWLNQVMYSPVAQTTKKMDSTSFIFIQCGNNKAICTDKGSRYSREYHREDTNLTGVLNHEKEYTHETAEVKRWSTNIYPVNDVLKTTSPTCVPEAPKDFALHTEPSSSTSRASLSFQGLCTTQIYNKELWGRKIVKKL